MKRSIYQIAFVLVALGAIFALLSHYTSTIHDPKIIKVNKLSALKIPAKLASYLEDAQSPVLDLIYFDGKNIYEYTKNPDDYSQSIYLQAVKMLAISPQHQLLPGYYLLSMLEGVHEKPIWPVLAAASTLELANNKDVVLIPDIDAMSGYSKLFSSIDSKIPQYAWEDKTAKIFWRGNDWSVTPYNTDHDDTPRLRLVRYASKLNIADVGFTGFHNLTTPETKEQRSMYLKNWVAPEDTLAYKYLLDVDGNSCCYTRMAWILYSNSVLMKHKSDKVQWYYSQLQPYVHYIPIAEDFSDLQIQYAWAESNPDKSKNIALNGRSFARTVFADENILLAFEQALIEYQKIMRNKLES